MLSRTWRLLVCGLLVALSACASLPSQLPKATTGDSSLASERQATINVFAAASLSQAFSQIGRDFEAQNPGLKVAFNFAGSQQLAQQIADGAPADIIASASPQAIETLIQGHQVNPGQVVEFAQNRLVVVIPAGNPGRVASLGDLAKPGVKLILAAKEVPAGAYAREFLRKASTADNFGTGFEQGALANTISYEADVKAVLSKILLGEADAGIVYLSDTVGAPPGKLITLEIPEGLNVIAHYPIAPVEGTGQSALAGQFMDYVRSPEGQAVLAASGFIPVEKGSTRQ